MLTGLTRYRLGWRKKMVLQVSEWRRQFVVGRLPESQPWIAVWRDATFQDVIDLSASQFSDAQPKTQSATSMPPPPKPREAA